MYSNPRFICASTFHVLNNGIELEDQKPHRLEISTQSCVKYPDKPLNSVSSVKKANSKVSSPIGDTCASYW